jgi:hypothetical protein
MSVRDWSWRRTLFVMIGWVVTTFLLTPIAFRLALAADGGRRRIYTYDVAIGTPDPLLVAWWIVAAGPPVVLLVVRLWPRR